MFEDVAQGRALDRSMCRYSNLQPPIGELLFQPNMAATLTSDAEAEPFECGDDTVVVLGRDLADRRTSAASPNSAV